MDEDTGVTTTLVTTGSETVTVAEPVRPSLVALRVAEPVPTAVTRPAGEIVAIDALLLDHAIARPVSTFPLASRVAAASCTVCPGKSGVDAGVTTTVATGTAVTLTAAHPCFAASNVEVAHTCATRPAPTDVTTPFALTTAVAALDVAQVTVVGTPGSPATTTFSVPGPPPRTRASVGGVTVTLVTRGSATVMTAALTSVIEPAVAVATMDAIPAPTAVTNPVDEMDAMVGDADDHETGAMIACAF